MKLYHLNITNFRVDGGAMFGVVPKALWGKVYPADADNLIPLSLKSLLIDTGSRVILIDCGIGDKQSEKFLSHVYMFGGVGLQAGLAAHGYTPGDVTDVILTHLHFDHCGGGVFRDANGDFRLTFPNAKYHVTRAHWEWATNPNPREADSFLPENIMPIRDLGALNLVEAEGELYPGIHLRIFNGHTRGQIVPMVRVKDRTLVFAADLFPFRAHLPLPWIMSYDVEPLVTLREKELFLEEACAGNYIFVYEHDYFCDCSRVHKTPRGVRATEGFSFETLAEELRE